MSVEKTSMKWYALRAISGKEAKAKEYIEKLVEADKRAKDKDGKAESLADKIAQVLIPTEKVYQMQGNKRVLKERNYLPGYILVEAQLTGEVVNILANTPNIMDFLRDKEKDGNKPVALQPSDVKRILGTIDEIQETAPELEFIVGEQVKVKEGPFKDFSGMVDEVNSEKKRLKVMVKIFGRKQPLELSFGQVEKE